MVSSISQYIQPGNVSGGGGLNIQRQSSSNTAVANAVGKVGQQLVGLYGRSLEVEAANKVARGALELRNKIEAAISTNKGVGERRDIRNKWLAEALESGKYTAAQVYEIGKSVDHSPKTQLRDVNGRMVNVDENDAVIGYQPPSDTREDRMANAFVAAQDQQEQNTIVAATTMPETTAAINKYLIGDIDKAPEKHKRVALEFRNETTADFKTLHTAIDRIKSTYLTGGAIPNLTVQKERREKMLNSIKMAYRDVVGNFRGPELLEMYNGSGANGIKPMASNLPVQLTQAFNAEFSRKVHEDEVLREALGSKGVSDLMEELNQGTEKAIQFMGVTKQTDAQAQTEAQLHHQRTLAYMDALEEHVFFKNHPSLKVAAMAEPALRAWSSIGSMLNMDVNTLANLTVMLSDDILEGVKKDELNAFIKDAGKIKNSKIFAHRFNSVINYAPFMSQEEFDALVEAVQPALRSTDKEIVSRINSTLRAIKANQPAIAKHVDIILQNAAKPR